MKLIYILQAINLFLEYLKAQLFCSLFRPHYFLEIVVSSCRVKWLCMQGRKYRQDNCTFRNVIKVMVHDTIWLKHIQWKEVLIVFLWQDRSRKFSLNYYDKEYFKAWDHDERIHFYANTPRHELFCKKLTLSHLRLMFFLINLPWHKPGKDWFKWNRKPKKVNYWQEWLIWVWLCSDGQFF